MIYILSPVLTNFFMFTGFDILHPVASPFSHLRFFIYTYTLCIHEFRFTLIHTLYTLLMFESPVSLMSESCVYSSYLWKDQEYRKLRTSLHVGKLTSLPITTRYIHRGPFFSPSDMDRDVHELFCQLFSTKGSQTEPAVSY